MGDRADIPLYVTQRSNKGHRELYGVIDFDQAAGALTGTRAAALRR